ncbi:MAG TPA: 50S ribosomal protein L10 [Candidatus Dormibacteraeota bacterium]|nr:50S ribosomal protein L10 [Candidatus Dormibacteraeota bacterium]
MKKRSEKQADLDLLKTELAKVSTLILTTFQGITVDNDTKLRRAVQAAGGKYKVVKNTLAERAGAGTPAEGVLKDLKGTNSIAFTYNDPVALAKALTKIAKDVPAFQFKAGVVEGRVISIAEIQSLANLPSKEELISKVMFLLNAPAQRLAMTLNALPRNLAVTVSEAIKINKFGSGGTAEKSAGPSSAPSASASAPAAAPEAAPAAAEEAKPEATPEPAQ